MFRVFLFVNIKLKILYSQRFLFSSCSLAKQSNYSTRVESVYGLCYWYLWLKILVFVLFLSQIPTKPTAIYRIYFQKNFYKILAKFWWTLYGQSCPQRISPEMCYRTKIPVFTDKILHKSAVRHGYIKRSFDHIPCWLVGTADFVECPRFYRLWLVMTVRPSSGQNRQSHGQTREKDYRPTAKYLIWNSTLYSASMLCLCCLETNIFQMVG